MSRKVHAGARLAAGARSASGLGPAANSPAPDHQEGDISMTRLSVLAASASSLALLLSTPALAQSADVQAEQAAAVGDIVVTAQRRSENIRDVPFAVTAMNTETLNAVNAGGGDILQLSGRVPSLQVESSNG
ncbi:hypothetical protein LTR94_030363, partial [Friedmanniomyces endolithicus]